MPGNVVQTYKVRVHTKTQVSKAHGVSSQELEVMAFTVFEKNEQYHEVHFHLEKGVCEDKLVSALWTRGVYSPEDSQGRKLHVYAHFEGKASESRKRTREEPCNSVSVAMSCWLLFALAKVLVVALLTLLRLVGRTACRTT